MRKVLTSLEVCCVTGAGAALSRAIGAPVTPGY